MTGIFITARLGSTRLIEKHLIEVGGKSFINWLVDRFLFEFSEEIAQNKVKFFIATSTDAKNKRFENYFKDSQVGIFYGSEENIPLRHLQCAEANNIKNIVSIDGDDILCSTQAARLVMDKLISGAKMAQTTGLPFGMNTFGYSIDFLKKSLNKKKYKTLETGWGKIFDKNQSINIEFKNDDNVSQIRMTLDYEDDAIFFKNVIENIGDQIVQISDKLLIESIIKNNWDRFNNGLDEIYWENFNKQRQNEE